MKRASAFLVATGLLAGCLEQQSDPVFSVPNGASAMQAREGFKKAVIVAELIAVNCGGQGIARNYSSLDNVTNSSWDGLVAHGYSVEELQKASLQDKRQDAGSSALQYLEQRGAIMGQPKSVCPIGKSEIDKQTAVGKLLKRV